MKKHPTAPQPGLAAGGMKVGFALLQAHGLFQTRRAERTSFGVTCGFCSCLHEPRAEDPEPRCDLSPELTTICPVLVLLLFFFSPNFAHDGVASPPQSSPRAQAPRGGGPSRLLRDMVRQHGDPQSHAGMAQTRNRRRIFGSSPGKRCEHGTQTQSAFEECCSPQRTRGTAFLTTIPTAGGGSQLTKNSSGRNHSWSLGSPKTALSRGNEWCFPNASTLNFNVFSLSQYPAITRSHAFQKVRLCR